MSARHPVRGKIFTYGRSKSVPTPTPGSPKPASPPLSPALAPQGPSQLLTALLARLPDATNRELIDQAAVDFSFLNSKAARKRLVRVRSLSLSSGALLTSFDHFLPKFLGQVPKNRVDLIPYYSRLVATLNKYLPDVGTELVSIVSHLHATHWFLRCSWPFSWMKSSDICSGRRM